MSVAERLAAVRERIGAAASASGRAGDAITLITVSKEVDVDRVREAVVAGALDLGENRAQELVAKAGSEALAGLDVRWHFIGRLQRNKVRALAPHVGLWQSVDRAELAAEIGRRTPGARVLVQVNVEAEPQKGGCEPGAVPALVETCRAANCVVAGLMTVPPAAGDPRPVFEAVRTMVDDLSLEVCSMGMSSDYEAAIECGSTMVRVGSAIFGPRPGSAAARR